MNKRKGSPNDPFKGPSHRMFNEDSTKTGVWNGAGTTRTTANSTLFVANIAPPVSLKQVEDLFAKEPGFFSFRTVRRMAFVDFQTIQHANIAMRKLQHHVFEEWGTDTNKKLMIDYDKDPRAKRNQQYEKQRSKQITKIDKRDGTRVYCGACTALCVSLRITAPKTFASLPRRKIDGNVVVKTAKYLKGKHLKQGQVKKIKRKGGIELQYRWLCKSCGIPVAYQSVPYEDESKHLILISTAIIESKEGPPSLLTVGGTSDEAEKDEELQKEMEKVREEMRKQRAEEEDRKRKQREKLEDARREAAGRRAKEEEMRLRKEKEIAEERAKFFKSRESTLKEAPTGKMQDEFTAVFQSHGPAEEK